MTDYRKLEQDYLQEARRLGQYIEVLQKEYRRSPRAYIKAKITSCEDLKLEMEITAHAMAKRAGAKNKGTGAS